MIRWHGWWPAVLAAALVAAAALPAAAATAQKPDRLTLDGIKLVRRQRYREAIGLFERSREAKRETPITLEYLGYCYAVLGERPRAAAVYEQLLEQTPNAVQVRGNLGTVLAQMGDYERAARELSAAVEQLRPDEARLRGRAAREIRSAVAQFLGNLGTIRHKQGRLEEAEAQFRLALEKAPTSAHLHTSVGDLERDRRRPEQAEAAYREALRLDPEWADAQLGLGQVLAARGRFPEAQQQLELYLKTSATQTDEETTRRRAEAERLLREVRQRAQDQNAGLPLDATPPTVEILSPAQPADGAKNLVIRPTQREMILVTGRARDDRSIAQVTVNGQPARLLAPDGGEPLRFARDGVMVLFKAIVPLREGLNAIAVAATDLAGNASAPQTVRVARPPAGERQPAAERAPQRWALLVGVNNYASAQIPALRFAVNDVMAMRQLLLDPERGGYDRDKVAVLTDSSPEKPTREAIRRALRGIAASTRPEDTVILFFSCHGYYDEATRRTYLLPQDCDPARVDETALVHTELARAIAEIPAKSVVTFLDACHSGGAPVPGGEMPATKGFLLPDSAYQMLEVRGRVTITSCGGSQLSYEDPLLNHGVFTYFLVEGLYGAANRDGNTEVTVTEAVRHVQEKLREFVRSAEEEKQEPLFFAQALAGDVALAADPVRIAVARAREIREQCLKLAGWQGTERQDALRLLAQDPETLTAIQRKQVEWLGALVPPREQVTLAQYRAFLRSMGQRDDRQRLYMLLSPPDAARAVALLDPSAAPSDPPWRLKVTELLAGNLTVADYEAWIDQREAGSHA